MLSVSDKTYPKSLKSMKEVTFIRRNIEKWKETEKVVEQAATLSPDQLADAYTELTADLAFAQTHFPTSRITIYLNNLASALHNEIYRSKREKWTRIITFWTQEVPQTMYDARRHELMVNVYQDERSQQIYSVIDKGRVMQQAFRGMTLLDYAINASLVLSYVAMRKEDKAGLVTFDEHFDTFVPASKQPVHMQTLLEKLYSQQTTFGETDFSALCVHLNKHVNKRSLLVLYTNFASISSMNRQLAYLQQLNRQHRLLVVFFEDADLKAYIESPARDTEDYYRHVIAEKFAFEKRLIVSTLKQNGIYSLLTTPENLSIDVINKYLEMKSRQLL